MKLFGSKKTAEPLIKGKKARKAVKAWAKLCGISVVRKYNEYGIGAKEALILINQTSFVRLEYCRDYTIAELCGEEE